MEIKEFALKVQKAIKNKMGEGYLVKLQEVQKNNGVTMHGLLILAEESNISPTIYLDSFWEYYERGIPFAVVIDRILQIYEEDTPKENIDMSFFKEFAKVKERICFRLISAKQNEELLNKIPYINYLDMAICFYYAYQGDTLGNGSILIYNSHMDMWNTSVEELYELAQSNTSRIFPWESISMESAVREMYERYGEADMDNPFEEEEYREFFEIMPMYVVSNVGHIYGAACVLYSDVLSGLAKAAQKNLYVIPSSIHEVIVLQDRGHEDELHLREIIREVNRTQVEPEEILSNNLYYYNRLSGELSII